MLPRSDYSIKGGRLESSIYSDDGLYSEVSARVDIPENGEVENKQVLRFRVDRPGLAWQRWQ